MSGEATTETTTPETAAPPVADEGAINYDTPNLARSGVQATEDGQAPGVVEPEEKATETTETATTDTETDEEKASRAGAELAGRKRTLVDDLRTTRDENKGLKQTLEQQQRFIESWKPVLEKLAGREDLQQAVLTGRITVAQAEAAKDRDDAAELRETAEDLGFFKLKADGTPDYDQPDLERAQRYVNRHIKIAEKVAKPLVQPFEQQSTDQKVSTRIEQAVKYATAQGDADPEIVREMFTEYSRKNTQWVLDDESGNTLYEKAVARSFREGKVGPRKAATTTTATTRTDPSDKVFVHTEAPGGKSTGPNLTAAERALGEQYGLTEKDWQLGEDHSKVRRGYSRLTED